MGSKVDKLISQGLIKPPTFLKNNIHFEVISGSESYGVSSGNSDVDICGFVIPPKDIIFPHLKGEIPGFGKQIKRFGQYQQHHTKSKDGRKEYDIVIYNIVKYFQLCMGGNPNMIDSLFVPRRCILHSTQIGELVRENRKIFLSKKCWHTYKGYAYSQMHKMNIKKPSKDSKRYESIRKHGCDLKFAYHVVRLLGFIEQILETEDLNLELNREQLKSIRRGEWKQEQIVKYFETKERELESLYTSSTLKYSPDEEAIKRLLLECLEMHYGSLDNAINITKDASTLKSEILEILNKY